MNNFPMNFALKKTLGRMQAASTTAILIGDDIYTKKCMNFIRQNCGAVSCAWTTTIVGGLFVSCLASAQYDLSVGGTFRSYPMSAVGEIDGGYNWLLWGTAGADSPWYGYLRPRLNSASAISYNSIDTGLDFYPLSFLGMRAAGEGVQNDKDYTAYNCVADACRGRFYRTYIQVELSLGYERWFAQGQWRREHWRQSAPSQSTFVEPTAGLSLNASGDAETIYRGLVGMRLTPEWSITAALIYAQSDHTNGISRFPVALFRYVSGEFSAGLGAGLFASPLKAQQPAGLAFMRWEFKPSLALD